eukprot:SAG11_NODE_150_length_14638_cov_3.970493_4_plen_42_part_00
MDGGGKLKSYLGVLGIPRYRYQIYKKEFLGTGTRFIKTVSG